MTSIMFPGVKSEIKNKKAINQSNAGLRAEYKNELRVRTEPSLPQLLLHLKAITPICAFKKKCTAALGSAV